MFWKYLLVLTSVFPIKYLLLRILLRCTQNFEKNREITFLFHKLQPPHAIELFQHLQLSRRGSIIKHVLTSLLKIVYTVYTLC